LGEDQRQHFVERFHSMILGLKTETFTIPDFMHQDPDFMFFLLYDFLSLQHEETLLKLFLTNPQILINVSVTEYLKNHKLFVTYCAEEAKSRNDKIVKKFASNWQEEFSKPYELSKQTMKKICFTSLPEGLD